MELMLLALIGGIIALVIGLKADHVGKTLGLLDFPDPRGGRKLHGRTTPLVGGLALVLTVIISATIILAAGVGYDEQAMLLWLIAAVTGLALIGGLDDRFGLSAKIRLALAALILVFALAEVPDFSISFLRFGNQPSLILLPGIWGIIFTVICFVGLLNAVNMADGKNGLVIGQSIIWACLLLVRSPDLTAPILAALIGALVVLFYFNMTNRLFLGDGGSYGISAMFGLLAMHAWNYGFADMRSEDIALIFAVPVLDTLRLIVTRVSKGKSPFTPGRDHLHHYLYDKWGWPKPLILVLALVAIPNALAIIFPQTGFIWLAVTVAGYIVLLAISRPKQSTHIA